MTGDSGDAVCPLAAAAAGIAAATLHEAAGKIGALPSAIQPIRAGMRVVGEAFPVRGLSGNNLCLHHAIYAADPGDVLVANVGAAPESLEYGYWGEVMAVAALRRGIAGLVITGGVRDCDQLAALGFPTFAPAVCLAGTRKDRDGAGVIGEPVRVGSVDVTRGDLVLGDADGVVVIPAALAMVALQRAREREADERLIFDRLAAGESTLQIYQLATEE